MSQQILDHPLIISDEKPAAKTSAISWQAYIPVVLAIGGAFAILLTRINVSSDRFISDGALMMLALASYLIAAVFYLTNLYAPFRFAEKLGLWCATLGVFFNLSSWLVRWVAAYDRELNIFNNQGLSAADMPWVFRYVPFANLYDLSLAFAFGAGVTTLLVMRRQHFRIVAALSLPLAAIILVLARFIGSELIDLPPVLDSYWRPIHVGIASMSYGIALVCFAVAVLYLLKDGLKVEKMAIWTSIFALAVFATISKFSIFSPATFGSYTASVFTSTSRISLALRADIPYVGWLIVAAAALLLASVISHTFSISKADDKLVTLGNRFLYAALAVQGAGIAMLVYQLKTLQNVVSYISPLQYPKFATWMMQQQEIPQAQINAMGQQQLYDMANTWITQNGSQLHLSLNANPVELAALITAFTGTLFVVLFGIKTEKVRAMLPSADTLASAWRASGRALLLAGIEPARLRAALAAHLVWPDTIAADIAPADAAAAVAWALDAAPDDEASRAA